MDTILKGWKWFKSHCLPVTKHDLKQSEDKIMKAIQDFAASANTSLGQIETAISTLAANQGTISTDDQTSLNGVQSRLSAAASNLQALANPAPAAPPAS